MKIFRKYLLNIMFVVIAGVFSFNVLAQNDSPADKTTVTENENNSEDVSIDNNDDDSVGMVDYSDDEAAGTITDESSEIDPQTTISDSQGDTYDAQITAESAVSTDQGATAGVKDSGGAPVKVSNSDRSKRNLWEWGAKRHHSSWTGTTGLMDIKEAGSAEAGTFGIGVFTGFFKYKDYLLYNDENTQISGNLNLRITPLKFLEIHASINALSNSNNKEYPALFQTLGDVDAGIKGFFSPVELITLGLDAHVMFLNSVGTTGMDFSGTSFGFDALATFDFTELSEKAPLRLHIMAGYFFDNAYNIMKDIEDQNGGCGTDSDGDGKIDYKGCLSPVERTALGIDRNDQVKIGFGLDALLPYVSPMIEYNIDIPVNRQGFTCPQIPGSYDACMADAGGKGMRQWLNLGVRVLPPVKDLAIDLGAEIGLSGYAPSVHELAAQEPYVIKIGLSYQFDPFPEKQECKEPSVQAAPASVPKPEGAVIAGMVHEMGSKTTSISGAVIVYQNYEFNPQITTDTGRFNSYLLPSGTATVNVSAEGYETQAFNVEIPASGIIEQYFPLKAAPKTGILSVDVVDDKGAHLSGINVKIEGVINETKTTDAQGEFKLESDIGHVTITVDDEKYLYKQMNADIVSDTNTKVELELKAKPKRSMVIVKKNRIKIKKKIHFKVNSDEIEATSFDLLDEIADIIVRNPQIANIEIQGHTDDRGKRKHNIELSRKRAESVLDYLTNAGVNSSRLSAAGFGPDKPVAPNITRTGRAKNRRVEFHIINQQQ